MLLKQHLRVSVIRMAVWLMSGWLVRIANELWLVWVDVCRVFSVLQNNSILIVRDSRYVRYFKYIKIVTDDGTVMSVIVISTNGISSLCGKYIRDDVFTRFVIAFREATIGKDYDTAKAKEQEKLLKLDKIRVSVDDSAQLALDEPTDTKNRMGKTFACRDVLLLSLLERIAVALETTAGIKR
jgi:hypothetical protein